MTDAPTCTGPYCARPAADAYLCTGCTRTLERILAELPATLADLQTTITRQARTSRSGGGKPTKAAESPLPYDVHASDLAHRVRNGLSTWIRHLAENGSLPRHHGPTHLVGGCQHDSCWEIRTGVPTIDRTEDMALWLVAHVREIRQDEAAGALLAQLKGIQSELRATVDNREAKFAGQCTAILAESELAVTVAGTQAGALAVAVEQSAPVERVCGAPLRMRPNSKTVTCKACDAEYPALEISRRILMQSQDFQGTATFIANALTDAGYPVKVDTIWKWAERSRQWLKDSLTRLDAIRARRAGEPELHPLEPERFPIVSWSDDGLGRPLYRVGDVWERVKAGERRRSEKVRA